MTPISELLKLRHDMRGLPVKDCVRLRNELLEMDTEHWLPLDDVCLLPNFACDYFRTALQLTGFRHGMLLHTRVADHDTYAQEILDPHSETRTTPYSAVILALCLDQLALAYDADGALCDTSVISHIETLLKVMREHFPGLLCINTFLPPQHEIYHWEGSDVLRKVNSRLLELAREDGRTIAVDLAELVRQLGVDHSMDPRYGFMFSAPYSPALMNLWAARVTAALACQKGRGRKVLALDCDNTLWGGIIGEDGMDGIALSNHQYPGNVYHVFQKQLLELSNQGVLLVLCSKNNEEDVLQVLKEHPACLLGTEHLAGFRINWESKDRNLQALADELGLGLDSFVFMDDSPIECELIRRMLPCVDVLQVPSATEQLPELLRDYPGFMRLVVTQEDRTRTQEYRARKLREDAKKKAPTLTEYLESLELVASIDAANERDCQRIAQLTQKTNQFNLTTRRYSEAEIRLLANSDDSFVLCLSAEDRFGDYGLTGVCIGIHEAGVCRIDAFLLSCRILGRRLEDVLLSEAVRRIRTRWGEVIVTGEYSATAKNAQVADFYPKHGFRFSGGTNMTTEYGLGTECDVTTAPTDFIEIRGRS